MEKECEDSVCGGKGGLCYICSSDNSSVSHEYESVQYFMCFRITLCDLILGLGRSNILNARAVSKMNGF